MSAHQDAYGKAMMDYMEGKRTSELAAIGCRTWFSSYDQWFEREQKAMQYVRGRVLDIGCGAGRHSLYLQSCGFDVMSIDRSPLVIEVCRRRGVRNARAMSITQVSRKLGLFDTLLLLGNNFGLMANLQRARWLLRRFHSITAVGGRILAGSGDPARSSNPSILAKMETNRRQGRMPGQFRMQGCYANYKTPWFDWLFVSKREMTELVEGTGWYVSQFLDDQTDAYVAVMEKADRNKLALSWPELPKDYKWKVRQASCCTNASPSLVILFSSCASSLSCFQSWSYCKSVLPPYDGDGIILTRQSNTGGVI